MTDELPGSWPATVRASVSGVTASPVAFTRRTGGRSVSSIGPGGFGTGNGHCAHLPRSCHPTKLPNRGACRTMSATNAEISLNVFSRDG